MESSSHHVRNTAVTIVACGLAAMLFSSAAHSEEESYGSSPRNEYVLTDKTRAASPGRHIEYLEDKDGNLRIDDVRGAAYSGAFRKNTKEQLNFGFTSSAYWLRLHVFCEYHADENRKWLLEIAYPLLNSIDLYIVSGGEIVQEASSGRQLPYHTRTIKNRNFLFPVDLSAGEHYTVYLRIKTDGSMNVPLAFQAPSDVIETVKDEQFFFGMYYGIIAVMAIFNLFLFLSVRNTNYLLYILYVVSSGLFHLTLNGLDVEYLWPNAMWWSLRATPILASLTAIGMNLFSKRFLQTKVYAPVFDRLLTAMVALFVLNIPLSLIFGYRYGIQVASIASIVGSFITIAAGIRSLLKGYRPARLYIVSWIGFIFGIVVLDLQNNNLVPYSFITNNSIQIGSGIEVVLMSFALADSLRLMQKEKEDVQKKAFQEQLVMTNSFSRFVPKEFLSLLNKDSIVNVELGDQVLQEMPVLFTDIRSYTSLSERMTPQENIDFLNVHLALVVPVIKSHNGFIDKFIGDAVMALFPGGVNDAVSAAVDMQTKIKGSGAAGGGAYGMPVEIGIGIHVGELMLGTIGEKDRLETTVISDAVNTASRLEGLNKEFGTGIIISDDVYARLDNPGQYNIRKIGLVRIRGREKSVRILEVVAG